MHCKSRNTFGWTAVKGLFLLLVSIQAAGAAPIPASSKARTQKDFGRVVQAWRYRTIVGAYAKAGNHKAKWDKAAKRFLYNYYLKGGNAPGVPLPDTLINEGTSLIKQGCNDAVVLSCYGYALASANRAQEAVPILQRALDAFGKSRYHKARECMAVASLIRARKCYGGISQKEFLSLIDRAMNCTGQSMSDGSFHKGEQRLMISALYTSNQDVYAPVRTRVRNSLTKISNIDPYFLKTTCGLIDTEEAWADRGDGWASTVTEAGWKGFFAHLGSANKLLTAAWKLHPEFPEAPTAMIRVAMGLETGATDVRRWFDRAVSAEVDHIEAYTQLQWALRPRWCGSIPALYSFAVDCYNTRRFDTRVPWMFVETLMVIEGEARGNQSYWNSPETRKRLNVVFDGYAKANYDHSASWFRSVQAGLEWHCGRSAEAKTLLKKLGSKVDSAAFYQVCGVSPSRALAGSGNTARPKTPVSMPIKKI